MSITKRGFCFNEQGTGKTASAIWAADYLINKGIIKKILVVCPLSIMFSAWEADLFKFAIHRKVNVAYGSRRKRQEVLSKAAEFVIINYDGVEIVEEEIKAANFDLIIIDEANAYKSVSTKRWKAMKRLLGLNTWLWMMTGTPAAQSPVDAFGLGKLCVPDRCPNFFGTFRNIVMSNVGRFKWIPRDTAGDTVFGLTLTAADTIIWYAPVTSLETYLQANARIDRTGQENPMTIVHISGSSVEKRLYDMLQGKFKTHEKLIDLYKKELDIEP